MFNFSMLRTLFSAFILIIFSQYSFANSCSLYFPDTVQGHLAGSKIKFEGSGQVIGDSDNILTFPSLSGNNGSSNTCDTVDCTVSGSYANALTLPAFKTTSSNTDVFLNNTNVTIGPGGDYSTTEVRDLVVNGSDRVTFLATATEYIIDDALFDGDAQITFNSGTYWFNELEIKDKAQIFINGSVTIYVNGQDNHFDIEGDAKINEGGSSDALALISYSDTHLKDDVIVNAVLYSVGNNIHIEGKAHFTGVISSAGEVKLKDTGKITYQDISNVTIGTLCSGTPVVVDHYEIVHDSEASVCEAESVTIKACANSTCSTLVTGAVSLNFHADGLHKSTHNFIGSTTINFNHLVEETLTLSIDSPSVTPDNPLVCNDGSGASCDIVFSSSGCSANSCSAYFPDSIQGHLAGSKIKFEGSGQVIGDSDNILTFPSLSGNNGSSNTCDTVDCTVSGSYANALTLPAFKTTSSNTDVFLNNTNVTIGPGGDYSTTEVRDLVVNGSDRVTFLATATEYIIDDALFDGDAQITFNSGTYWFNELEIKDKTQIFINGSVTIYVNGQDHHFDIEGDSKINEGGAAGALALVSYSDTHLKHDVIVNAVLYSVGNNIHIEGESHFTGVISSAGEVKIKGTSKVTYQSIGNVKIGTLCGGTPVVVDHYEIVHDGAGSVCAAESVTIKACANSTCSTLISDAVSLDFHADGLLKSTHNFIGSTTINFNHLIKETLTLSVESPSVTPDNPLVCNDGSGASCDIVFSSGGCSANSCAAYFPDSIQGHLAGSKIKFEGSGQVMGDSDNILTFPSISGTNGSSNTCNTTDCTVSGSYALALTLPVFQTTSSTIDIAVNNVSATIGPGGDYSTTEVRNLVVNSSDIITFLATATEYKIDDAVFKGTSQTTFNSGTYWFNELEIKGKAQIFINGSVTIYVNGQANHFDIENNAKINEGGAAGALALVSYSDTHLKNKAIVNAVLYSEGNNIHLETKAHFTGVISSAGQVKIKGSSKVTFEDIGNVQIGTLCGSLPLSLHHFEIEHDGTGLTCAAEPIKIKACSNSDCSVLSDELVSFDFQGNGSTKSSPSFTGSTSFVFHHTSAETVTLSIANPSIEPESALVCSGGAGGSCDLVFAETGFLFLVDGEAINIPTQLSGKPSNVGFESRMLSLQAVKTSALTGACEAALTSNVTIEFIAECDDPISCAGQQVTINNGINDTLISTQDKGSSFSYSNVAMDFGTNTDNTANFVLTYPDAGKIKLYVRHNILDNGLPSGNFMSGNSNSFVVRPFGFYVNVDGNTAAEVESGDIFKKAGENFETTLTAVQWEVGDDNDIDGVPDNNAVLSNNAVTPNFNNETNPDYVVISHVLILPAGGHNPALSVNAFTGFTEGVSEATLMNWPEVGIISFNAHLLDNKYIGASNVTGSVPYVGRFTPDHFSLAIVFDGDLNGGDSFVYTGQMDAIDTTVGKISYLIEPEFTITAKSVTESTTKNYTGIFMKMEAEKVLRVTPVSDGTQLGVDEDNKVNLTADLKEVILKDEGAGVILYKFHIDDNYYYTREANAIIAPFPADIDLQITSISDEEGISAQDTDEDVNNGILTLHPSGPEIRFGRWYIENGFGPETSPIVMPMYTQYWNGSTFTTNEPDKFTPFDSSLDPNNSSVGAVITDISLAPATTTASGFGTFEKGETRNIILSPPEPESQGAVTLGFNVPTWLQYDWENVDNNFDGPYVDNPSATATFGLYRGNDRIIYWREVF